MLWVMCTCPNDCLPKLIDANEPEMRESARNTSKIWFCYSLAIIIDKLKLRHSRLHFDVTLLTIILHVD